MNTQRHEDGRQKHKQPLLIQLIFFFKTMIDR